MALRTRWLVVGAVVVISLLYPFLKTGKENQPTETDLRVDRLALLHQREGEAGARMVALTERDSGAIPAAGNAVAGIPTIRFRGFPANATAPIASEVIHRLWQQLGTTDSAARVTLLIYNAAEFRRDRIWTYGGAYISLGADGPTCVAMISGGVVADGSVWVGKEGVEQVLAPCALLAGFGAPGPSISQWLVNTRYAGAASIAWLGRNKSFIDGQGAPPWMGAWQRDMAEPTSGLASISILTRQVAGLLSPPYELGAYGLRCTEGYFPSCRRGILDSTAISRTMGGLPSDLTFSWSLMDRPTGWTLTTPMPPGESWLSDLIRDQGRDKFAQFWKSSAPFEQAFQNAFGEDLGAWTQRWSVRQWENSWSEKYRGSPRILGATMEPSWPLLALGWTGVLVLLTALVAQRRQIT